MAAVFRLKHPRGKTVVEVDAERRDTFLDRGWSLVEEPTPPPKPTQKRTRKPKAEE